MVQVVGSRSNQSGVDRGGAQGHGHHRRRGRNDQGANISPMVIMLCMKVWQAYQDSPVKPPVKSSVQDLPRR